VSDDIGCGLGRFGGPDPPVSSPRTFALVAVGWTYLNGADDASPGHSPVGQIHLLIAFVGLLPDLTTDVARVYLLGMMMICTSMATIKTGLT